MVYHDEVSQEEMFEWAKNMLNIMKRHIKISHLISAHPNPESQIKDWLYLSRFFNHAVSYFALPLICNHNKELFEVYTYAVRDFIGPVSAQYKRTANGCH